MTQEPDQLPVPAGSTGCRPKGTGSKQGPRPRAGVPVWRTGKPDAFLAAAVDVARAAVEGIAPADNRPAHGGPQRRRPPGDAPVRIRLPGYLGWQWYAVLTRNSRSKVVTVDELGLLPSEESILAPAWVPWAERVRPEDEQPEDAAEETPPDEAPAQGSEDAQQDAGDGTPTALTTVTAR